MSVSGLCAFSGDASATCGNTHALTARPLSFSLSAASEQLNRCAAVTWNKGECGGTCRTEKAPEARLRQLDGRLTVLQG